MMHERVCFVCEKKQTISVEELFREAVQLGLAKHRKERINELFWYSVDNKEMCPECFNIKEIIE